MCKNPEFIMFLGPMWSNKSTRLIAMIDRSSYQKKKVVCFKPKMDDRYSLSEIVTHGGLKIQAMNAVSGKDIISHISALNEDFDIVAVDEAFMIEGAADALIQLFKLGKTIIVSSLEMSAACNPFEEIIKMMPWATTIEKCASVCACCQQDAYYTHKKSEDTNEIQVGGGDIYEPRCWSCHGYTNELNG